MLSDALILKIMKSRKLVYKGNGITISYEKRHRKPPLFFQNKKPIPPCENRFSRAWVIDMIITQKGLILKEECRRLHYYIGCRQEKFEFYRKNPPLLFQLYNSHKRHNYSLSEIHAMAFFERGIILKR